MKMLRLSKINVIYDEREILKDVDVIVNDYDRVGIIGNNGTGKTSLFNVIVQSIDFSGSVYCDDTIGYMRQIGEYNYEDFVSFFNSGSDFLKNTSEVNLDIGVNFTRERMNGLSGGEKTKLILSYVLSNQPSLLILDEPTNHLDSETVEWLIEVIRNYSGTVIVISHNRYFLNEVVNSVYYINNKTAKYYYGNYDFFKDHLKIERDNQIVQYNQQLKFEKRLNKDIERMKQWTNKSEKKSARTGGMLSDSKIFGAKTKQQMRAAKLSKQSKAKISRLEKSKQSFVDKPHNERTVKFGFKADSIVSKSLITINYVEKSFESLLFSGSDIVISKGDKISLIGANGSGKTTLLNIIMGTENFIGDISFAPKLKIAYLSQDVYDLNNDQSIISIANQYPRSKKEMFISNLVNMNISREVFYKKIKHLSMGERMRIKLTQIIIDDYNMLILDEPTNHLDIENKECLERTLSQYEGSVIIVSHDKYSLGITNKTIKISNRNITQL